LRERRRAPGEEEVNGEAGSPESPPARGSPSLPQATAVYLRLVRLLVRLHDDLTLDAGSAEAVGTELVIQPPSVTLFHQVIGYLRRKPDPPAPPAGSFIEREGAAAASVALRWGSYLAVLADKDKPIWSETRSPGTSRIADSEMARINIEASSALAEWIDLYRKEPALYEKLALRAVAYLPVPKWKVTPAGTDFAMLAVPQVREQMTRAVPEAHLAKVRADAEALASRVFSNALINSAWRNGPVEEIHGGVSKGYPLDKRRISVAEERMLIGSAIDRLTVGMEIVRQLVAERPPRPWTQQVVPYGLAERMLITPVGWTLTEDSREVRLPSA
jgi:hypothetical protein